MGNGKSSSYNPLQYQWCSDNVQTFMVKGHRNKIFGCDVIISNNDNCDEIWIASCSADGRLMIHEVLMETLEQRQFRRKVFSSQSAASLTKSKSLSSIRGRTFKNVSDKHKNRKRFSKKTNNIKPFEIEINRLLSIPLDSTVCYTVSLHPNCRYVSTCIDRSLFIFEVDFNAESPIYNEVKIAKKYISGAQFIDDRHIVFCSGDGNVYIYNFIQKQLVGKISYTMSTNKRNRDILCFDYGRLKLDKYSIYNENKKELIVFGTVEGNILIYDISDIVDNDLTIDANSKQVQTQYDANLLQTMYAQFGAEILCLSVSNDGKFIVIGSEDNTYNIYNVSILERNDGSVLDIKWILLCKQIVPNDANINHVAWINDKTFIASCDKGKELYLSGIYDIRDNETAIQLIANIMMFCNKDVIDLYEESNEAQDIMIYIVDIILEYVMWITLYHKMSVGFDERISCIATCSKVNDSAGFVVVGGFSKLLQCFLPLRTANDCL